MSFAVVGRRADAIEATKKVRCGTGARLAFEEAGVRARRRRDRVVPPKAEAPPLVEAALRPGAKGGARRETFGETADG